MYGVAHEYFNDPSLAPTLVNIREDDFEPTGDDRCRERIAPTCVGQDPHRVGSGATRNLR